MKMERNLCVKEKRVNVRRICPVREGPKEPGEEEYRDINWGGTAERFGPCGIWIFLAVFFCYARDYIFRKI